MTLEQLISKSPFFAELSNQLCTQHKSDNTIRMYLSWIRRLTVHHSNGHWRHPFDLSPGEVQQFLASLHLAARSHNQCLAALRFLYIDHPEHLRVLTGYAHTGMMLPTEIPEHIILKLLQSLTLTERAVIVLIYGSGLSISEAMTLRRDQVSLHDRTIHLNGRVLPLGQRYLADIKKQWRKSVHHASNLLFPGVSRNTLQQKLRRWSQKHGRGYILTAQTLRASCIMAWCRQHPKNPQPIMDATGLTYQAVRRYYRGLRVMTETRSPLDGFVNDSAS